MIHFPDSTKKKDMLYESEMVLTCLLRSFRNIILVWLFETRCLWHPKPLFDLFFILLLNTVNSQINWLINYSLWVKRTTTLSIFVASLMSKTGKSQHNHNSCWWSMIFYIIFGLTRLVPSNGTWESGPMTTRIEQNRYKSILLFIYSHTT